MNITFHSVFTVVVVHPQNYFYINILSCNFSILCCFSETNVNTKSTLIYFSINNGFALG